MRANQTERKQWSIISYYGTVLRRILSGVTRPLFVLASTMHALGHALVAIAAGAVAVLLAQRWGSHGAPSGLPATWDRVAGPLGDAFSWSLVGLAVVFVKGAAGVYATYVQGRVAGEVGAALRLELLDALLAIHRLRQPRHDDHRLHAEGAGLGKEPSAMTRSVAALTDRVHDVELGLKHGFLGGARAVAQLVPLAGVLAALSARTALVAAGVLAVFGALLGRVRTGYRAAAARAGRERTLLLQAADESVRHAELWISYGAEEKARSRVATLGTAIAGSTGRLEAQAAALSGVNEVLGAAALAVAILASRVMPRAGLGGAVDGRTLVAFAVAFFLAYRPLRELADARMVLARAADAYEELAAVILSAGADPRGPIGKRTIGHPTRAGSLQQPAWPLALLELRGLRLAHGPSISLSLRIEPGSIVAVTGPTGVGKTTLLRTLLGFEHPAGGDILFDDLSIADAPAGPSSRPFAWVPQDAPLLADTLEANLALGALDPASPTRNVDFSIAAALNPMGAGHLAHSLGAAHLGAGGRAVSGGERQWIALARAIATRQPILLLDEPTSGLDADAQRRVLETVATLRGRRTVILVTHRLESLAVADVVVRLDASGALQRAA